MRTSSFFAFKLRLQPGVSLTVSANRGSVSPWAIVMAMLKECPEFHRSSQEARDALNINHPWNVLKDRWRVSRAYRPNPLVPDANEVRTPPRSVLLPWRLAAKLCSAYSFVSGNNTEQYLRLRIAKVLRDTITRVKGSYTTICRVLEMIRTIHSRIQCLLYPRSYPLSTLHPPH